MAAKLTVEFDDQTEQGFDSLVQSLGDGEVAAKGFSNETQVVNLLLTQMAQNQHRTAAAIEANTAAVVGNRDSFFELSNSVIEFTGHMKDGVIAVKDGVVWIGDKLADQAIRRGAIAALSSLGAKIAGVGPQLLALKLGTLAVETAFKQTGKTIEASSANVSIETRRMIADIKAGLTTVDELAKQTGKTVEELGIKTVSNWDRIKAAAGEMKTSAGDAFKDVTHAAGEASGASRVYTGATRDIQKVMKATTETAEGFFILAGEGFEALSDKVHGQNKAIREHREELKRQLPILREIQDFEHTLERQIRLEQDLADIKGISTQQALRDRLEAERFERDAMSKTAAWNQRLAGEYEARISALARREVSLREETEKKKVDAAKKAAQEQKKLLEEQIQAEQNYLAEQLRIRQEARQKEKLLQELEAQGQEGLALQQRLSAIELAKQKLEIAGGREKDILALEKTAARERADFEFKHAKTAEDRIRIKYDLQRELRELDLRQALEADRKKAESAKDAIDAQRAAMEKFKASGQNQVEKIIGGQTRQQVFDQLLKDRLAKETAGKDLSSTRRHQIEMRERRGLMGDIRGGRLGRDEVAQAQQQLASRQIGAMQSAGKVTHSQAKALRDLAKTAAQLDAAQEDLARENFETARRVQAIEQAARGRQQRTRAQRRGTR